MGNKISVIIPHYPFNEEINRTLKKCVDSLPHYDELIVVVNQGTGFAKAVNQGLSLAKGDYLMVVNNDIVWHKGELEDMCVPDTVTSPIVNASIQPFWGCFFCIPRSIYEKVGGLDERFGIGFYEDDDYRLRLEIAKVPMQSTMCVIETEGSKTMSQFDKDTLMKENKAKFLEKWQKLAL
jgi:O-antigen biosynthesis protein